MALGEREIQREREELLFDRNCRGNQRAMFSGLGIFIETSERLTLLCSFFFLLFIFLCWVHANLINEKCGPINYKKKSRALSIFLSPKFRMDFLFFTFFFLFFLGNTLDYFIKYERDYFFFLLLSSQFKNVALKVIMVENNGV
jgi:hypothetical protein